MTRVRRIVEKALGGGQFVTRAAIGKALAAKGIEAAGIRLGLIVFVLELDQVVCSGPRQGKQFTYALFDERVRGALVLLRRRGAHGAGRALRGQPRSGDDQRLRVVVRADGRRSAPRVRVGLAGAPHGIDRRPHLLVDDRRAAEGDAGRCRPSTCCRSTTSTSSPTAIGSRRRRCCRRARRPIRWTATRNLLCVEGRFGGFWRRTVGSRAVARAAPALPDLEPRARGRGRGSGGTLRRVPRPAAGVQRAAGAAADTVKPQRAISA